MKVAVISDVHGNVQALEAVLVAIDELQVDEIWSLGDVVGYGADPVRCMEIVDERAVVSLAGNHDLVVAGTIDIDMFAHDARDAAEWSRTVLSQEQIDVLGARMPGGMREDVQMFHASIRDPVWEYIVDSRTAELCLERQRRPLCLVGHSHVQLLWGYEGGELVGGTVAAGATLAYGEGPYIVNPGSVGQPRDGDWRAAFAVFDSDTWIVSFYRIPYHLRVAQEKILAANLPHRLATRLATGR
jgi:predicted phosphodiesterase